MSKKKAKNEVAKMPQDQVQENVPETATTPPDLFNPDQLKQIETLAALGLSVADIGAVMGVSKATMERRIAANSEVAEARRRGKAVANSNIAKVAYEMAKSGRNHHMTKFWLSTQAGWSETSKVQLTGADGGPVELTAISAEERAARLKALDEKLKATEEE